MVVTHRHHGGLAVLFSTDLDLDPVTLYRYYVARFPSEFLFRDSKQFTGPTHGQARDVAALTFRASAIQSLCGSSIPPRGKARAAAIGSLRRPSAVD
ncbi:MAG: hypothetical protein EA420_15370 [Candidatus Competibacteraceae bacterium]|nr:MAG: hypothetical protein EA420_15370 [Candidatus Competibacteraceae bacterium]